MNEQSLQIMRRLLRPASAEEQAKIARQRTAPDSFEQLTLADAGLVDEVRELVRRRKSGGGKSPCRRLDGTATATATAIVTVTVTVTATATNASGQLFDGVDVHDCAARAPLGGQLGHVWCLWYEPGTVILNQAQALGVPRAWRYKTV